MTDQLLDHWESWQRAGSLSEQTIQVRARIMRNFIEQTGSTLETYTSEHIATYLARPELSANSRAAYYRAIKAFGVWMIKAGHTESDPSVKAPKPRHRVTTPRPVNGEDLLKLIKAAPGEGTRLMLLLGAFQGLRVHEIAKLQIEDFDLYDGSLTVTGKGGKTAILPLHDEVRRQLLKAQVAKHGYVFPSPYKQGLAIVSATVYMRIRRVMETCEVPGTPHCLRHYFGTELVRAGVNLRVVQTLMRHSSLTATQIYTLVDSSEQRAGITSLKLVA